MSGEACFPDETIAMARTLVALCRDRGVVVATAESCTGGLISTLITETPGSSEMYDRGFIVYSNDAKRDLLGVSEQALASFGSVSAPVARAMAEGALARSAATAAVAVTGVAGPGGGTAAKPVGLINFACAVKDGPTQTLEVRFGDVGRREIRFAAARVALQMLTDAASARPAR